MITWGQDRRDVDRLLCTAVVRTGSRTIPLGHVSAIWVRACVMRGDAGKCARHTRTAASTSADAHEHFVIRVVRLGETIEALDACVVNSTSLALVGRVARLEDPRAYSKPCTEILWKDNTRGFRFVDHEHGRALPPGSSGSLHGDAEIRGYLAAQIYHPAARAAHR